MPKKYYIPQYVSIHQQHTPSHDLLIRWKIERNEPVKDKIT